MAYLGNLFFKYLIKEFLVKFFLFFMILIGVVYLFEVIELIQRSADKENSSVGLLFQMALLKLPDVGQQILPFITLFAAIATLKNLTDRQELVCIRAAGLSAWQFLIPIVTATFCISVIYVAIIHPLSAASIARYDSLYAQYLGDGIETITVIDDGIWLRQEDASGNFILKAKSLNAQSWTLKDVTVFFFDSQDKHTQRIDAKTAKLNPREWQFSEVSVYNDQGASKSRPTLTLSTNLTIETLAESFSNPQTISFWRLPYFIESLDKTGVDTSEMRAYYQSLLSMPFLLVAMIFLAASITLRTMRVSSLLPIVAGGLGFGFITFFMSGFLRALGLGNEMPMVLAIWSTPTIIMLLTITFLAQLEDG